MSPCENDTYKLETKPDRRSAVFLPVPPSAGNALLTLYVEQLGVTDHSALNMWSGIVFSITFFIFGHRLTVLGWTRRS